MYSFSLIDVYMNTHTTLTMLAIVAAATLLVAAVAAPVMQPVEAAKAKKTSNNQQNFQLVDNFNNQQFQSNFQCIGCSP